MSGFYVADTVAGEMHECATEAEALAQADESLVHYRRDARRDGEWSLDVEGVEIGRVVPDAPDEDDIHVPTHRATAVGDASEGFDYVMRPVPAPAYAATPAP